MSLPASLPSFLLIGVIIMIAVILIFVFVEYRKMTHHIKALEAERDRLKSTPGQSPTMVLEDAQRQAMAIITRAEEKAQQILSETKQFHLDTKRIFENELKDVTTNSSQELRKASEELLKNYEASLKTVKDQDINLFKNITNTLQSDVTEEIKDFKQILRQETVSSQKAAEQKLTEEFAKVGKEVLEYKKDQLAKADSHILEVLHKATALSLGRTLSASDHRELIMEALEQAKKETTSQV